MSLNTGHHPKIATLALSLERFTKCCLHDHRDASGTWFVVTGRTGVGKTHCAKRLKSYYDTHKVDAWSNGWLRLDHIPNALWVDWANVANERETPPEAFRDWLVDELRLAHLVIMDDLGAESEGFKNGEGISRLRRVLEACESKWLFATTNISPERWEEAFDRRVSDRLLAGRYLRLHDVPSYRVNNGART